MAAVVLLPLLAGSAPAVAAPALGLQGVSAATPAVLAQDMTTVRSAHGSLVRIQASWSSLQPSAGDEWSQAELTRLDGIVDAAASHRLKVVLFSDSTPCWASSAPAASKAACTPGKGGDATRYPPVDPQDYARFSVFLAQRYGAKLAAYQLWNEPDQASEDYWAGPDKVARYVALMKATYPALKAAVPRLPVLAGSFVGGNGAWLRAMYQAGAKGFYDGLAVQFYDLPLNDLRVTRQVQRQNGDRAPLWLTEFGWSSCYRKNGPSILAEHACLTQAGQAQAVVDTLRAIRRTSWIKAAILYSLRDESSAYRFGLLDRAGRRKTLHRKLVAGATRGTLRRPVVRLAARGGRIVITGSAPISDLYSAVVRVHGAQRWSAGFRTDRFGRFRFVLPRGLGTSAVRVQVRASWSGRSATAKR